MDTNNVAISPQNHDEPSRRSANYAPTVWGDYFLAYSNCKENFPEEEEEHERLKEEVRKKLQIPADKFELIDTIRRLGVSYHFETEIEALVPSMLEQFEKAEADDLDVVALRFRLLRQLGHYVSCDVFEKFKDSAGSFKECLVRDVRGLLSLFEAANYRIHDEDILEEALIFTTSHLQSQLNNFIKYALEMPIHKTLPRLGTRKFISFYEEDHRSRDEILLNFAKLDFNMVQRLHKKELGTRTKWWKGIDCPNKFSFARDKLVECYLWILEVYCEPKYSFARILGTKVVCMLTLLDDMYDVHGTLDELTLFTDSIQRWHISAMDQLPPYMQYFYQNLLNLYSEIEEWLAKVGKSNFVNYAISSVKAVARAYYQEAIWIDSGYVPSLDEYMENADFSGGYQLVATNYLVLILEFLSEDVIHWVVKNPVILRSSTVICRLMDDMATFEVEKERNELASGIECYMRQYGTSQEEAIVELEKMITNAWKVSNKECFVHLHPHSEEEQVPLFVFERIFNLSRIIYLYYKDGDLFTNSSTTTKDFITSILVDPIPRRNT